MGNNPKISPTGNDSLSGEDIHRHSGSWRQAIFKTVVTPKKDETEEKEIMPKRPPEELRQLWKKAINQQVLLIRMEKENARIRARQEEKEVKRIKLEYDEIGSYVREVMEVWDLLDSKENRFNARCDNPMLIQAVRQGVPRSKRGDVWHYLAEQFCLKAPPIDLSKFPNYNVPYEHLLKQLTSHQHAILIDLGRTFPNHAYFSSPLGPGQLALFNILKAYSLLDPEVGYCQGLSFVAGVLLLHMSEDNAFFLLRHLMFRRGLRRQYLPDMAALHVHLYQLSRLLHDQLPELFCHLDRHEVTATLYAAPWMLTLFASQFPLGFVTRVFDLLFVESPEVIFRVSIALMIEHREGILNCGSFEEIIDYLKSKVPLIDKHVLDRVLKKVFTMDISKQLNEYEVEYHVLQEEQSTPRPEAEKLKAVMEENRALLQQVEITTSNLKRLETSRALQQAQMNRLESQVRSLEVSISTLGGFIASLTESHKDIEIPGDVRRLVAQLTAPQPDRRKNSGNLGLGNIFKHNDHHNTVSAKPEPNVINKKGHLLKQSKSDPPKELPVRRGFPLKVIEDDDQYDAHFPLTSSLSLQSAATLNKVKNVRPHPLKSANSSPNLTARVSSLFGQNHERNHPDGHAIKEKSPTGNGVSAVLIEDPKEGDIQSKTAGKDGSFIDVPLKSNEVKSSRESPSDTLRPPLRKDEIMKQLEAVVNTKSNPSENVTDSGSHNSCPVVENVEYRGEESQGSGKCHPLDSCSGVSFSFGGTTKLKTFRPLKSQLCRNATVATFDSNSLPVVCGNECSAHAELKQYDVPAPISQVTRMEKCQNLPLPNEKRDLL